MDDRALLELVERSSSLNQLLLSLTFSMLLSYEFDLDEKLRVRKLITKTQSPHHMNDPNAINALLNQLFNSNMYFNPREKEFSWQVSINRVEII